MTPPLKSALHIAVLSAWLGSSYATAEVVDCVTYSAGAEQSSAVAVPNCEDMLPEDSPWRFGVSVGYGRRSNPLINSDDIPVYGMVQLAYTGDRFFFDNGDVGAFLTQGDDWELNLIAGEAPAMLADLPAPDAVFVGGGLSVEGLVETCLKALKPGGRLVANAVTVEGEARLFSLHGKHGGQLTRIAVSRAEPVGAFQGWRALMPITQWILA